jgi:hypothetical protein
MTYSRYRHTASVLSNGTVLVAGGYDNNNNTLSTAELYHPLADSWILTGNMTYSRFQHTASILLNGTVLVAGGIDNYDILFSAELY